MLFKKHRSLRIIIQLLFLSFFIFLFLTTVYGVRIDFQNIYFRFDPLLFFTLTINSRFIVVDLLPSLILIVITFLGGRFFCGFICPLGAVIDFFGDGFIKRLLKSGRTGKKIFLISKSSKYVILLFILFSAILGGSFIHFFDPLVIFERFLTFVALPIGTYFAGLYSNLKSFIITESLIALLYFFIILALNFFAPRFWCRFLCPLGGFLSLISKISIFKFSFTKGCSKCSLCSKVCPTDAIDFERETIDAGECINCFRCQYECPDRIIKYNLMLRPGAYNIHRRHFLEGLVMAVVGVSLARSIIYQKSHGRLIRPPGAIPESDFLNTCIRCGKCIKICPTNGLQPCFFDAGVDGLWTPHLVARIGGCEKNCNLCGRICPTKAIRNLPLQEKTYVKIGTAVIDRSRCLAWEQNITCLICDEACPYNAINNFNETIQNITIGRPFVDERLCTGCGICETRCPIEGRSAIEVYSIGEERKKTGSYITPEKIKLRSRIESKEDIPSGFILPGD